MSAVEIFKSKLLQNAGFTTHGFTKRTGGVSEGEFASLNLSFDVGDDSSNVAQNLSRLKDAIGVDAPLLRLKQVHGPLVVDADSAFDGIQTESSWSAVPTLEADGMVASGSGVLAVQTADCAPILLASPSSGAVAAIHSGWRSLARGIVQNAVRALREKEAGAADLIAVIGPCICLKCYEVGDEVARKFPESCDPIKKKQGKHLLDLGLAAEVSLIGAGLTSDNIERIDTCTHCFEELFSHRRDDGHTGRMLGFISTR